jgi:alpha-aminoadipic semialdehyde synthase
MTNSIGLRLEDKDQWERRVVLIPSDVKDITNQGVKICVERSPQRAFGDESFLKANAELLDDVRGCDLVLGVKEIPAKYFRQDGAYIFFSHTFKGQPYNMKMLATMVEKGCTLIDYELIADQDGERLIFFGRYAGIAGMVDTLWTLGRRLRVLGLETPFLDIEPTRTYGSLVEVKNAVKKCGERIQAEGLPDVLSPMVIGFTGYGNVSQGAQEIFDLIPHVEVEPKDVASFVANNKGLTNKLAKVVYKEEHLVEPIDPAKSFELQDYYDNPSGYRSIFEPNLALLSVIVNGIYWEEQYPKFADVESLKNLFKDNRDPRLLAVGDITCDVDGSFACTVRDTDLGDPVYVYDPETRQAPSGFDGPGLSVMAVGNLPAELPREASMTFSTALKPFISDLANVNLKGSFEEAQLPSPIRNAVILWQGEFTPKYKYMQEFLR